MIYLTTVVRIACLNLFNYIHDACSILTGRRRPPLGTRSRLDHPAALFSTVQFSGLEIAECSFGRQGETLRSHILPTSVLPGIHFSIAKWVLTPLCSYLVLACCICVMPTPQVALLHRRTRWTTFEKLFQPLLNQQTK